MKTWLNFNFVLACLYLWRIFKSKFITSESNICYVFLWEILQIIKTKRNRKKLVFTKYIYIVEIDELKYSRTSQSQSLYRKKFLKNKRITFWKPETSSEKFHTIHKKIVSLWWRLFSLKFQAQLCSSTTMKGCFCCSCCRLTCLSKLLPLQVFLCFFSNIPR